MCVNYYISTSQSRPENGNFVIVVFLDFVKALDIVNHCIALKATCFLYITMLSVALTGLIVICPKDINV